ncbi:MAG: DNA mismatch repair protein MutS, partial [Bacteroidota bacterium]
MQEPESFYPEQLDKFNSQVEQLRLKSTRLSILRVLVFIATVSLIYFFFSNTFILSASIFVGLILFLWLLSIHTDLRTKKQLVQRLVLINIEEQDIAKGFYMERNDGKDFISVNHSFAQDIDLFGRGSFFQYLNRTGLKEGTKKLAAYLNSNNIEQISRKQEAIRELAQDPEWMQHFTALAKGLKTEDNMDAVLQWINGYNNFLKPVHRYVGICFGLLSLGLLSLTVLQWIPMSIIGYWLLLGLAITSFFLKRINTLAFRASKTKEVFRQYALLLNEIEGRGFSTSLLIELQTQIQSEGEKASLIFTKF